MQHTASIDSGLRLGDGSYISYDEMCRFLQEEAPGRYPGLKDIRVDTSLVGMVKLGYFILTYPDRLQRLKKQGKKIVAKFPANPIDPYYGAGAIGFDPFVYSLGQAVFTQDTALSMEGRRLLSPEACAFQAAAHAAVRKNLLPIDMFYPCLGPWCSTTPFNGEALRDVLPRVSFLDQAFFGLLPGKEEIAFQYYLNELKNFFSQMEELTGLKVTEEGLRDTIRLNNRLRQRCRQLSSYLGETRVPISSMDYILSVLLCTDWGADPVAALDILETMCAEAQERVVRGQKGMGLVDEPIRVFFLGITTGDLSIYNMIDELGGVTVGLECVRIIFGRDADEEEEPLLALARRNLTDPYVQPVQKRCEWILEVVKQFRPDCIIFDCTYGCNYLAKTARYTTDRAKEALGVPCFINDVDLPFENQARVRAHLEAFFNVVRDSKGKR